MRTAYDIIIRPIITEKSMEAIEEKKYVFEVAPSANKIEIRKAIETIFGVKVQSVNTVKVQGKTKRMGVHVGKRSDMKKAYIQLTADSKSIELFEGMV
ncbi:MAG: 50S ribosomal protein L23 [Clostridia bacterium]|nr:50S ribosomal protein L23 [Clostridia bacterium]